MKIVNLSIRFLLELCAWILSPIWVYRQFEGMSAWLAALGTSLLLIILWTIFAAINDPSRSGKAPIPINGKLRLLIEFFEFGLAVGACYGLYGQHRALILFGIIVLHHLLYFERMRWIWKQNRPKG